MATQATTTIRTGLVASMTAKIYETNDVAERYQASENAPRPFSKVMIDISKRLITLTSKPTRMFDLACGTGAVEAEIYASVPKEQWDDVQVVAGDISPQMLEHLEQRKHEQGWRTLHTQLVDAAKLDDTELNGGEFAHAFVSGAVFALPPDTLPKLARKVAPGGTLGISVFAHLPWFSLLQSACRRIENGPELPTHEKLYAGMMSSGTWHEKEFVRDKLQSAGLRKAQVVTKTLNVDYGTLDPFYKDYGVYGLC